MTSNAASELTEALTRLHNERDAILEEIAGLERDLADKHETLADMHEKVEALEKTLKVLHPEAAQAMQSLAPPAAETEDEDERDDDDDEDEAGEGPESKPATDFSHLSRQMAVLGVLAGTSRTLHYSEIARIVDAPASSISANLSHLKYRQMVESTEPGVYQMVALMPIEAEPEVNEALRNVATAIVDDQQWEILEAILEMDERLPFVGFEHFRRNRLAHVAGAGWANDRLTHALMKEVLARDLIEVYHKDNPRNPEFPTAAIRLTDAGLDEISD